MARRVGFGRSEDEQRATVDADSSDAKDRRSETPPGSPRRRRKSHVIGGVFLSIWLVLWTAGIIFAFTARAGLDEGDEGRLFLLIWLVIAVLGWLVAVRTLLRIIAGKPVSIRNRGGPVGPRPQLDQHEPDGDFGRD